MREILFRGQDIKGNWHIGLLCHMRNAWYISNSAGVATAYEVIPKTIGQYTGFIDKNGAKIFEGDIIQYIDVEGYYPEEKSEFIGKIVFESGAFGIGTIDNIPINLDDWCANDNFVSLWELDWNLGVGNEMLHMIEVIGNIHDNFCLYYDKSNA